VAYTGMYALSDSEQIDIDLLAVPGHPSTAVVEGMLDVCQNLRQDCLAIIDPPFGLTVEEIVAWQNGTHPLNADRFDSDFGALYWPWVQIYDTYSNLNVWVPPSGSVMATIARSDFLSEPWFAPAGLTRGVVPGIANVFTRPTLTERDLMYGNSNAINPIITFPDIGGFVIWGQKTLQRLPTLLDRVNVRRLMFAIEKQMKIACRGLLFEPNDSVFTQNFLNITSAILKEIQVGRGLFDYIINVGSDLNTAATIASNEFHANIGVQPIPDVEFIYLTFSINLPGAFSTSNGVDGF
jgi:phage tail sheath protein FI